MTLHHMVISEKMHNYQWGKLKRSGASETFPRINLKVQMIVAWFLERLVI